MGKGLLDEQSVAPEGTPYSSLLLAVLPFSLLSLPISEGQSLKQG